MTPERLAEIRNEIASIDISVKEQKADWHNHKIRIHHFKMYAKEHIKELLAHIDAQQRTIEQLQALVGDFKPHTSEEDCPMHYDGCNCRLDMVASVANKALLDCGELQGAIEEFTEFCESEFGDRARGQGVTPFDLAWCNLRQAIDNASNEKEA